MVLGPRPRGTTRTPLVPRRPYAKSGHSTARLWHSIDYERSYVQWIEGAPEATRYWVTWMCTRPSPRYPFELSKGPIRPDLLCRKCDIAMNNREILKRHGWTLKTIHEMGSRQSAHQNQLYAIWAGAYKIGPDARIIRPQAKDAPF